MIESSAASFAYIYIGCVHLEWSVEQQTPNCLMQLAKVQHQRPGYELKIGQRGIRTPQREVLPNSMMRGVMSKPFTISLPPTVLCIAYSH